MRSVINHIDQILRPEYHEQRANNIRKAAEESRRKAEEAYEEKAALSQALNDWLSSDLGQFVRTRIEKDKSDATQAMISNDEKERDAGRTKYLIAKSVEDYLAAMIRDYRKSQIEMNVRG